MSSRWLRLGQPMQRRDCTLALVGATSWFAVAWRLSRIEGTASEGLLALGAGLLCLWPVVLALSVGPAYAGWREFLVPAHLALQHWVGLHFRLPRVAQPLVTPPWGRHLTPMFLAAFCQPWLYLAFAACLQRIRLRTFLWAQPLLLGPVLWGGRSHCAHHLAAMPEAAQHLQLVTSAVQRLTSWLPVTPVVGSSGDQATTAQATADSAEGVCMAVHCWLVLLLAYGVPAIIMHRLEGQEQHTRQQAHKDGQQPDKQRGSSAQAAPPQRDLLLQRRPPVVATIAELLLAGCSAWLLVQQALPLVGALRPQLLLQA